MNWTSGNQRKGEGRAEGDGERGRNRTYNLVIKSHLLCQLSYAPDSGLGKRHREAPPQQL
jgi:hypothetical protein